MENTFKISKQQITYLHEISGDSTKLSLEEMFPEAFESELKTGIWYKHKAGYFFFLEEIENNKKDNCCKSYGFRISGNWDDSLLRSLSIFKEMTPATDEEVFESLKEEAIRRGFKKGVTVDRSMLKSENIWLGEYVLINEENFSYKSKTNELLMFGHIIFSEGKWAEICITREEAEKELGKKII